MEDSNETTTENDGVIWIILPVMMFIVFVFIAFMAMYMMDKDFRSELRSARNIQYKTIPTGNPATIANPTNKSNVNPADIPNVNPFYDTDVNPDRIPGATRNMIGKQNERFQRNANGSKKKQNRIK
tara:strand:+ start:218 stop:595 length:378 start_codon:yes stop_codon:yes gene_type:complete